MPRKLKAEMPSLELANAHLTASNTDDANSRSKKIVPCESTLRVRMVLSGPGNINHVDKGFSSVQLYAKYTVKSTHTVETIVRIQVQMKFRVGDRRTTPSPLSNWSCDLNEAGRLFGDCKGVDRSIRLVASDPSDSSDL